MTTILKKKSIGNSNYVPDPSLLVKYIKLSKQQFESMFVICATLCMCYQKEYDKIRYGWAQIIIKE